MEACEEFRDDAFGDVTEEDRQELEDAFTKFSQCMRDEGVDVPDASSSAAVAVRPAVASSSTGTTRTFRRPWRNARTSCRRAVGLAPVPAVRDERRAGRHLGRDRGRC
jgi:hypothetical protein